MSILFIYVLGIAVYCIIGLIYEYAFDHDYNLGKVTTKEWLQDLSLAPLSWISVVLVIAVAIYRFCGGEPKEA